MNVGKKERKYSEDDSDRGGMSEAAAGSFADEALQSADEDEDDK
jgi:hypothetical protein